MMSKASRPLLYYVHDPMCSWCWAFVPVWQQLELELADWPLRVEYLLGGLAPDSDEPMALAMQQNLQAIWRRIQQQVPGTEFNFDFWTRCQPRRSTWPACRAVIAAANQQQAPAMITAIQQAYYLRALNPADRSTLVQLAQELQLDETRFSADLDSQATREQLRAQIEHARRLPISGFPSLVLQDGDGGQHALALDYSRPAPMLAAIEALLGAG